MITFAMWCSYIMITSQYCPMANYLPADQQVTFEVQKVLSSGGFASYPC